MNRAEAVERAAAAIRAAVENVEDDADQVVAILALDASGYPAALAEAIEILRDQQHVRLGFGTALLPTNVCAYDHEPWPCRTARFLAEHDETT